MIQLHLEQGSPEWFSARAGLPTASCFDKILTAKTLKLSAQAGVYRNQLLAEWIAGYPMEWAPTTPWMERGTELEPQARGLYSMMQDVEVKPGGFILRDDREVGGSPDGLVGADGGVELKCPAIHTHIGYLLNPQSLVEAYRHQVQGYLYLTGREWWDVFSFHPELPAVLQRVERDDRFINGLDEALGVFVQDLTEAKKKLATNLSTVGV